MLQKEEILSIVAIVWLIIAAVVLGYPLAKGQMRVGLDVVSRDQEPQRFWSSYLFSSVLFLATSAAVAYVVNRILH